MPRTRLTDEERLARKRERLRRMTSGEAYAKYNPSVEGYGDPESWRAAAEALAGAKTTLRAPGDLRYTPQQRADLSTLSLDILPEVIAGLKSAFRQASLKAHPDHGGTNAAMRNVLDAYKRLLEHYQ